MQRSLLSYDPPHFMKYILSLILIFCLHVLPAQTLEQHAVALLSTFSSDLKKDLIFTYDHAERSNWHYVPRTRKGIPISAMNDEQQKQLMEFIKASLSEQGYQKTTGVLELEDILRSVEGRPAGDDYRDRLNYSFSFFGEPAKDKLWGWRLEGHHLSLNFSASNGNIEASTPSFFGANPATVPSGKERGRQTLKKETELAFALLNSLSTEQRKTTVFATTPPFDILTRNDRKATLPSEKGIMYSSLTSAQQDQFLQLLDVYIRNYELGFADKLMAKIKKAGIDQLSFAWAGSQQPGAPHYYRIQGPMLLIEFDNTQNNGNHIHSVVRDLTNDFAEDILSEHLARDH